MENYKETLKSIHRYCIETGIHITKIGNEAKIDRFRMHNILKLTTKPTDSEFEAICEIAKKRGWSAE